MIPKKIGSKSFLICDSCGFELESLEKLKFREKNAVEKVVGQGVVLEQNFLADYEHICRKCGYNKAQIIDKGIYYSDEDNLILLKCGKCGYCERIGRKVS